MPNSNTHKQVSTDVELREMLKIMINNNGVMIPLSQKSEGGLEYFKMTNGYLFLILNLGKDDLLHYETNIGKADKGSFTPQKNLIVNLVNNYLPAFKN